MPFVGLVGHRRRRWRKWPRGRDGLLSRRRGRARCRRVRWVRRLLDITSFVRASSKRYEGNAEAGHG